MDKQKWIDELTELTEKHAGLLDDLLSCESALLQAHGKALQAYQTEALTDDQQKQKDAIQALIDSASEYTPKEALDALRKQIDAIVGNSLKRAWEAYRATLRPGKKATSTRREYQSVVVACSFKDRMIYVVTDDNDHGVAYKLDDNKANRIVLPTFLKDYPVTSLSAVRKLAWAIVNNKAPAMCHDGIGKPLEKGQGGELAKIVSHDPTVWLNQHSKAKSA